MAVRVDRERLAQPVRLVRRRARRRAAGRLGPRRRRVRVPASSRPPRPGRGRRPADLDPRFGGEVPAVLVRPGEGEGASAAPAASDALESVQ